jgi:hypothetical protein
MSASEEGTWAAAPRLGLENAFRVNDASGRKALLPRLILARLFLAGPCEPPGVLFTYFAFRLIERGLAISGFVTF